MSLRKEDASALQKIVELEGKCLRADLCLQCPFRSMCLPEFLNPHPPTRSQRLNMALDILTHHALMDPEVDFSKVKIGRKDSKSID